jgi:hypothetical protein
MGLITNYIAYRVGKRVATRSRPAGAQHDVVRGDPECLNYESFCKNYGSCDDMECDYGL